MEETFENYLKQARNDFAKVALKYTVTEHLELRTAIDSLLIAYDQAVAKALISPEVIRQSEQLICPSCNNIEVNIEHVTHRLCRNCNQA